MTNGRNIVVKKMPERLHLRGTQELRRELDPILKADRPAIVFDFGRVRQMDGAGVEMLIECLDAAMKRDGDIKLAAVPPELCVILELTRVDRMFEMFDTLEAAVESFEQFSTQEPPTSRFEESSDMVPHTGKPNGHFKLVS
jgi:anti-sigma B factor antagonist